MKQFEITYFGGPTADHIVKPEVIADIAASGITLIPLNYDIETNKKALKLLNLYGMKAIVSDERINEVFKNDDFSSAYSMAEAVEKEYSGFGNILGWDITDEPEAYKFPILSAIVKAFQKYSPNKESYINLFPNYATLEDLSTKDYMTYLESFINMVDIDVLSYDHYHFRGREVDEECVSEALNERDRKIRIDAIAPRDQGQGFFENIEDVNLVAKKYDLDPMQIILLIEHGSYRNLTRAEILWEVNMSLAYGMRRISYFTYWTPEYDPFWRCKNAMVDINCEKLPHYYDVQSINKEILDIGRWLFDKNTVEIFHIGTAEAGTKLFTSYNFITSIDGSDGVISFFDDGSVYLVNRSFQSENTFTIHTDSPMTIRKNGIFVPFEETIISLDAGAAVLLKI